MEKLMKWRGNNFHAHRQKQFLTLSRKAQLLALIIILSTHTGCQLSQQTQVSTDKTMTGTIDGTFAVNPNGAATYNIPIQVPPGTNGMQPRLELAYNSQAGMGLLGMGGELLGLSKIERTGATIAQDGFTSSVNYNDKDRYVIDGDRLMVVDGDYGKPGSVYQTEVVTWKKVTAVSESGEGPKSFVVSLKNGTKAFYGQDKNSRVSVSASDPTIRTWALDPI